MDKIYISHYHSPIGEITMAGNGEALIGLWFDGQKYFADTIDRDVEEQELQVFAETDRWLTLYFQGQEPDFTPPIAFGAKVSEFRKEVWKILLSIPYGKTLTYGDIARQISARQGIDRMSAQAVGGCGGRGRGGGGGGGGGGVGRWR